MLSRLAPLSFRQQLAYATSCVEVLRSGSGSALRQDERAEQLDGIVARLWALATGLGAPDIWDDADTAFALAEDAERREPTDVAARSAALAAHFAVRTWLLEQPFQAVLAHDQALRGGHEGTPKVLERLLVSIEAGIDIADVRRNFVDSLDNH